VVGEKGSDCDAEEGGGDQGHARVVARQAPSMAAVNYQQVAPRNFAVGYAKGR
jgi:hypothetical protein